MKPLRDASPTDQLPGPQPQVGRRSNATRTQHGARVLIVALLLLWTVVAVYLAFLPEPPDGAFGDNVGHFAVSAMLGLGVFSVSRSSSRPTLRAVLWLVVAVLLAVAVELSQQAVGRTAEVSDFVADLLGVLAAAAIAVLLLGRSVGTGRGRGGPSTVGLVLVALLMTGGLGVALAGPVRSSGPVQNWWQCSGARQPDPQAAEVRLDERNETTVFRDKSGDPLPTEATETRNTLAGSTELMANIRCTSEVTVMAWATSTNTSQVGPTRVVSSATGIQFPDQNFHLGQEGPALSVRIRSKPGEMEWFQVENVFDEPGPHHLAARFSDGRLDVFVDGALRQTFVTEGRTLDGWSDYPLSVGDEVSDDRAFKGTIMNVQATSEWLSDTEIEAAAN